MLAELAALVALVGLTWWVGVLPRVLGVVFLVVLCVLVATAAVLARKTSGRTPAMRLDLDGVTFSGCPTIPWAELVAVDVGADEVAASVPDLVG